MNKTEFLNTCRCGGYCNVKTARAYAEGKDEFSDEDIENVYRIEQDRISKRAAESFKYGVYQGVKCTKHLVNTHS